MLIWEQPGILLDRYPSSIFTSFIIWLFTYGIKHPIVHCAHLTPDAAVSAAWKEAFPDLAYIWDTLRPIQKADMGRLALLYLHGGFYFDLDVTNEKDTDLSE